MNIRRLLFSGAIFSLLFVMQISGGTYSDNHNNDTLSGWTSKGTRSWSESGGYAIPAMSDQNKKGYLINDFPCTNNGTFFFRIKGSGDLNSLDGGAVFRFTDTNHFYFVTICESNASGYSDDNMVRLKKNSTEARSGYVTIKDKIDFSGMDNTYSIRIGIIGSTFSFWLNDNYLGQYTDTANPSGSVGYAYDDLTNAYVSFDSSSWTDAVSEYIWDISTAGGIQTGNGIWGVDSYWTPFDNMGTSLTAWPGKGNSAIFTGPSGAYTITVDGIQTVDSLSILSTVYSFKNGTINFGLKNGIYVDTNTDATIGSVINGSAGLSKYGSGTLLLTGTNTYSGATVISAGTLLVDGSISQESAVTVASGATLGGTGTCNGPVTVTGGTIAPAGSSSGKFSTGTLTLNAASVLNFDLGTKSDTIAVTGELVLDGTINFSAAAGFSKGIYRLITCSGTVTDQSLSIGEKPAGMNFTVVSGNNRIDVAVTTGLIQTEPKDTIAVAGRSVSFSVLAKGEGTLHYKWLRYPSDSVGNMATLTLTSVTPADTRSRFRCVVSDSFETDSSSWALLTVIDTPHIVSQPQSIGAAVGKTATFSLSIMDTVQVTYSWRKTGSEAVLGTSPSLTITPIAFGDSGSYYCIVGNPAGTVTSKTARLVVGDQKPSAAFEAVPTSGYIPLKVAFTDVSIGIVTSRLWKFGDGGFDTSSRPVHIYTKSGHYTVILIVANANGADTLIGINSIYAVDGDSIEAVTFFDSTRVKDTVCAFDGKIILWKDSSYTEKMGITDTVELIKPAMVPAGMIPVSAPFVFRVGSATQTFSVGIRIDSLPENLSLNDVRIYRDSAGGYLVNYETAVDTDHGIVSVRTNDFHRTFIAMIDTSPPKVTIYSDTASTISPAATLKDSLDIKDNIVNVRWYYSYGRGDEIPVLRKQGEACSATERLSLIIPDTMNVCSPESGLRSFLVTSDGVHTDTVNLSRCVVRNESDKITVSKNSWTPICPTAELNDKSSTSLIERLLSNYNTDLYNCRYLRLYRWINLDENALKNDKWVEYDPKRKDISELFTLEPGRMIWLKIFENIQFHLDSGHTLSLKDPFTINIPPQQWTDFGMPYRFGVRIEEILSASSAGADSMLLYLWKKNKQTGDFETDVLYAPGIFEHEDRSRVVEYQPGSGYSLYNRSSKIVKLCIPPVPAVMATALVKTAQRSTPSWGTKFIAQTDHGVKIPAVYFGYADGITGSMYPLSPSFAALRVSAFDRATSLRYGHYIGEDARKGLIKELMISNDADTAQTIRYHLANTGAFPETYAAFCFDAVTKERDSCGSIAVPPKSVVSRWVIIGDAAFQQNFMTMINPLQFSLQALYPNPSRSVVNIRYTVPFGAQERIGITIHNVLGKQVWEKSITGLLYAGSHLITWNGRDDHGCSAGSGLYVVVLTVKNTQGKVIRRFEKHVTLLK